MTHGLSPGPFKGACGTSARSSPQRQPPRGRMGADERGAFKGRELSPRLRCGGRERHGPFKAGSGHVGVVAPGGRAIASRAAAGALSLPGANGPGRGARGRTAGCGQPDTLTVARRAPAPAPLLDPAAVAAVSPAAGKQAPPSLTYFFAFLKCRTTNPTFRPIRFPPAQARPRPPIAVPNPLPRPPMEESRGARIPASSSSQSRARREPVSAATPRPIRARLGGLIASCVAARECR